MIARFGFPAFAFIALAFAAIVFEAAVKTEIALELIARAEASDAPAVREALYLEATNTLTQSWARPAHWHAGASEALSGAFYGAAAGDFAGPEAQASARWAKQAVRLSPVQPNAWLRLALLAKAGAVNGVCTFGTCLERAWQSAPVLAGPNAQDSACVRMRLTHEAGLLSDDDPRLIDYARTAASRRQAALCLGFLPPERIYEIVLAARR